jgi:hypothetical protein
MNPFFLSINELMKGGGKAHDILKVKESANKEEIRKAYLDLALIHHPDKGGDTEIFQSLQNAYERIRYDGDTDSLRNNPMRDDPLYYDTSFDTQFDQPQYYQPQYYQPQYYQPQYYQPQYYQPQYYQDWSYMPNMNKRPLFQKEKPSKPKFETNLPLPSKENIDLILARALNKRRLFNQEMKENPSLRGDSSVMDAIIREITSLSEMMNMTDSLEKKTQLMYDANLLEFQAQEIYYNLFDNKS